MKKLIDKITILEQVEYAEAVKKWGYNHSAHEGYAVLREEVEELAEDVDEIEGHAGGMWHSVKCDDFEDARYNARQIKGLAIRAAAEAVQVAAMAQKFIDSEERRLEGEQTTSD